MTIAHEWTEEIRLPDGHRIFNNGLGKWAVADESGRYPENTDDGVLWLDHDRPIHVTSNDVTSRNTLLVPVKDSRGTLSSFVTDAPSMFKLSYKFGWPIVTKDTYYGVVALNQGGSA